MHYCMLVVGLGWFSVIRPSLVESSHVTTPTERWLLHISIDQSGRILLNQPNHTTHYVVIETCSMGHQQCVQRLLWRANQHKVCKSAHKGK